MNPDIEVTGKPCPLFVPLVEEGLLHDSVTDEIEGRYLAALKEKYIDTLVMGCTHYPHPLSQTGPEKTEFPIEIVSGTEAVKQFWGSVSEGLDYVMSQLKEAADLSLSQLRELRGWMKEAVEHSVVNVCENRVDLGAEIGETLLALISGALMGIDNAFNVPTDTMDEFFSPMPWPTT